MVTGYWSLVGCYWLKVIGYWLGLLVIGWRLLVGVYWLEVIGYWSEGIGYWLLETFIFNLNKIDAPSSFIQSYLMLNHIRWFLDCWIDKFITN